MKYIIHLISHLGLHLWNEHPTFLTHDKAHPILSQTDKACVHSLYREDTMTWIPKHLVSMSSLIQQSNDFTDNSFQKYTALLNAIFDTCIDNFNCFKGELFHNACALWTYKPTRLP